MKKFNTAPISGMQELLPNLQTEFNRLKSEIAAVFGAHGFQNIETPTIERTDILLAKAGGETEKQIYKVVKTAEANDSADQALRFDHTVPLARYVVEHMNDLVFPFKVSQIGRNFRGERAQKGRFREFYQCDVDVIGWQNLPVAYDAEVIDTLAAALQVLPLPSFAVRISNRKLLTGLLQELSLQDQAEQILGIIDHAEKVPPETTVACLRDLGLSEGALEKLTRFMKINGKLDAVISQLESLSISNEVFRDGVAELRTVLSVLEPRANSRLQFVADLLIVRGLDYYTGTVFETICPEYRQIGSVCSGGRYDNLAQNYTDQSLPGVGGSIGLTRLFYILNEYKLINASSLKTLDVCIAPITSAEIVAAKNLADQLRAKSYRVDIILTDKKLGDKIKYASKVADHLIIIGETEAKSGNFVIKNLVTGEEQPLQDWLKSNI